MDDYFDQLVFDHFSSRSALMQTGEISDCKGLVKPCLWYEIIPSERRCVFVDPLSMFVEQELLPLELVGFNKQGHSLYRKKYH
jgi:hypothetical protein